MLQVGTPKEVLEFIGLMGKSEEPGTCEVPGTFTPNDIRRLVSASKLGEIENSDLFYPQEDFSSAVGDEEDWKVFAGVLDDIRGMICEILVENGNNVYCPVGGSGEKKWVNDKRRHNLAIKVRPSEGSPAEGDFEPPMHENLGMEKIRNLTDSDGKFQGVATIADDKTGVPTLAELKGMISLENRLKMLVDAMKGCAFFHSYTDKVHRDVKPDNILVHGDPDGLRGELVDWELVVDKEGVSRMGGERVGPRGTLQYFDMCWGCGSKYSVVPGVDVFAFGVSLLEMYCDETKNGVFDKIRRILVDRMKYASPRFIDVDEVMYELPSDVRHLIPDRVFDVIFRMLSRFRRERPSIPEVIGLLREEYQF